MKLSRLLRNIFSNYALMAVTGLTGLLLTPLLFHRLQPTGYAILVFAGASVAVAEALDLGLFTALIRFVSDLAAREKNAELRALVSSAFYLLAGLGAVGTITIAAMSLFLARYFQVQGTPEAPGHLVLTVIGLSLAFSLPSAALRGLLMGCQDFLLVNALGIALQLIRAATMVVLLYAGFGLLPIAALFPATALLELIGLLAMARRASVPFQPSLAEVHWASLKLIWGFASLTFVEDTLTRWFFQVNSFLAAKLLPLPDLAILAVARRFPQALTDLSLQPLYVTYPMVSSASARNDQAALERFMMIATRNILALMLPIAAALFVWAEVILRLWIGENVLAGVPVFKALLFFAVFAGLQDVPLNLLYGVGKIRFSAALSGVLLVAAIGVGAWACVHYGLFGLAVSYAAIQMAGTVLLCAYSLRFVQIPFRHWLRKAVAPNLWPALLTILWFWISSRIVAHNLVGMTIATVIGFALFFTLFAGLAGGLHKQPWKTRVRRLLTEID
ncbi:MAG: hypothetical protein HY649_00065 [Acidobacteria bacterium]|nr:hypothetical protein [Acidobacteriota bacterium]